MRRYTATELLRRTFRYKRWRKAVLEKDNHACVQCGSREKLTADHIKPVVAFPELVYDVENGRTLCGVCRVKGMLREWDNGELRPRNQVK